MLKMWVLKILPVLLGCAASSIVKMNQTEDKSNTELTKPHQNPVERNSQLMAERRVYLEDVFFSIKNMQWEAEEQLCLNQTLDMLTSLQNFTLWAVAMWDATASEPRGVLYGTRYQLGNYDECLHKVWTSEQHPHLTTQYCLADVRLIMEPRNLPKYSVEFSPYQSALDKLYYTGDNSRRPLDLLTWGTCVPGACSPRSVGRLLTTLLHRSNLAAAGLRFKVSVDQHCEKATMAELKPDAVAFFAVFAILVLIAIASTMFHWIRLTFYDKEVPAAIESFSMLKNLKSLAARNDGGLDVLYGIRYLSICFIILSHRSGVYTAGALSNGLETDQAYQNPLLTFFLVHDDLLVDTFFLMGGLLVTRTLLSAKRFPNIVVLIVKRYVRLAPALAVAIWYMTSVFESSGDGPLWQRTVEYEVPSCRRNWWTNLLMISNYYNTEDMCIVTSWYIPCDFHFFLLALWLCYMARSGGRRLFVALVPLSLMSVLVSAVITYHYRLPAILLFFNSFVTNPRGDETFQRMYIPSHTRPAPYLVGVAAGYLVTKVYPIQDTKKLSMAKSTLIAAASLLAMFIVMVTGTIFYEAERQYSAVEAAVYAAANRPAWAIAVVALVVSCAYGDVPLVTPVLKWSVWVPLSKLAYGLYLVHMFIISRDVQTARDPAFYHIINIMHRAVADIGWGTFFALLLWLLVEAPCINLLNACLFPRARNDRVRERDSTGKDPEIPEPSTSRFPPPGADVLQAGEILRSKF